MIVHIPNICQEEVKYTFSVLLQEFLGLEYEINVGTENNHFVIENGNKSIVIQNYFFHTNNISDLYKIEKIPSSIENGSINIGSSTFPLTSIFGSSSLLEESDSYTLDSDIISASFYMLSRWEEHTIKERDEFDRFSSKSSLAEMHDFLERPIVNEYVEILWELLMKIGCNQQRKERRFRIVPTHDVDLPFMWYSSLSTLRSFGGKLKKLRFREFWHNLGILRTGEDPWDTHNMLMDKSERLGVKSNFFFMAGGNTKFDNRYSIENPRIVKLINQIKSRGHEIGLHPSYNSYNDIEMLKSEKHKLEAVAEIEVKTGRQHFLRFSIPETWKEWDTIGMEWDSTLSYADKSGFRCGVCFPFPVYDILERKPLKLVERPLICMENSLIAYEKLTPKQAIDKVKKLKSEVSKYNGEYVFLWHNSSFNTKEWFGTEPVLEMNYRKIS